MAQVQRKKRQRRRVSREESYGQRVARLRRERGISQVELADMLGVDQPTVSDYERGKRRLHGELIAQLVSILGVSSDEILGLDGLTRSNGSELKQPFLRRLRKIDQLSAREQRALIQTLDAFLERSELRKARTT